MPSQQVFKTFTILNESLLSLKTILDNITFKEGFIRNNNPPGAKIIISTDQCFAMRDSNVTSTAQHADELTQRGKACAKSDKQRNFTKL